MAVIGTIDTDFLAPGISANGRYYSPEVVEKAIARLQARLADPEAQPVTMLSHHAAKDDSTRLCARVLTAEMNPATHLATLHGYLIDTAAGKDIASATEPGPDGRRVLDSVSIRGWWLGPVRKVDIDGQTCETGDDLEIDGVDFTKSPGVAAARIQNATRLTTEADARTPITESVEATVMPDRVIVHSTSTPTPADVPPKPGTPAAEAAAAEPVTPPAEVPAPVTEQVTGDAGPLTAENARQRLNETLAAIREAHVRIGGWQGPVDIDLDAWGLSNDDVAAAAGQLGAAYTAALRVLDPDNDGDLDLPGDADSAVTNCPSCAVAMPAGAVYCPICGEAVAESTKKENTVPETKTADGKPADETVTPPASKPATEDAGVEGGGAVAPVVTDAPVATGPTLSPEDIEAISTSLAAKIGPPPVAATETAPVPTPVVETADERAAAIKTATDAAVKEATDKLRADVMEAYGPPKRKGLVEAAAGGKEKPAPEYHKMSPAEFTHEAGKQWAVVLGDPDV